jgi:hypothetical protein
VSEPVRLPVPRHDLERLVNAIKDAVYDTAVGMSLTETIGAIEIAKIEIYKEQKE